MNKSKSIVKQASILALAGILVRIIGVLYRSPLTALIGDEGNGYYSTAYNIYAMVLLISSYSIPTAISKLISEKLALHQYNNARKIFKCALIYITVVGGSAALLTFILAPWIVTENAVFALRILCPTIFLSGLVGVLRGYFQAYSTTVYTSVSQIIEQILNAVVSVGAAYLFIQPYANNHTLHAKWNKMIKVSLDLAGGVVETTYTEPKEHTYAVPYTGTYKLETWGAQGGDRGANNGGKGGYTTGEVYLKRGDILYIYVGGSGKTHGGYNFSVIQQHTNIQEVLFSCFFHVRELEKYENNYYFQEYNDIIQDCLKKF